MVSANGWRCRVLHSDAVAMIPREVGERLHLSARRRRSDLAEGTRAASVEDAPADEQSDEGNDREARDHPARRIASAAPAPARTTARLRLARTRRFTLARRLEHRRGVRRFA